MELQENEIINICILVPFIILYFMQLIFVATWVIEDMEDGRKLNIKNVTSFLLWLIPFIMYINMVYKHFKED